MGATSSSPKRFEDEDENFNQKDPLVSNLSRRRKRKLGLVEDSDSRSVYRKMEASPSILPSHLSKCIEWHKTKPWLEKKLKYTLIAYPTKGENPPDDLKIFFTGVPFNGTEKETKELNENGEGYNWYLPSNFFWNAHCFIHHQKDSHIVCDSDNLKRTFIDPEGNARVFVFAVIFDDETARLLDNTDYDKECNWWNQHTVATGGYGEKKMFLKSKSIYSSEGELARSLMKKRFASIFSAIKSPTKDDDPLVDEMDREFMNIIKTQGKSTIFDYVAHCLAILIFIKPESPLYKYSTAFRRRLVSGYYNSSAIPYLNTFDMFPDFYTSSKSDADINRVKQWIKTYHDQEIDEFFNNLISSLNPTVSHPTRPRSEILDLEDNLVPKSIKEQCPDLENEDEEDIVIYKDSNNKIFCFTIDQLLSRKDDTNPLDPDGEKITPDFLYKFDRNFKGAKREPKNKCHYCKERIREYTLRTGSIDRSGDDFKASVQDFCSVKCLEEYKKLEELFEDEEDRGIEHDKESKDDHEFDRDTERDLEETYLIQIEKLRNKEAELKEKLNHAENSIRILQSSTTQARGEKELIEKTLEEKEKLLKDQKDRLNAMNKELHGLSDETQKKLRECDTKAIRKVEKLRNELITENNKLRQLYAEKTKDDMMNKMTSKEKDDLKKRLTEQEAMVNKFKIQIDELNEEKDKEMREISRKLGKTVKTVPEIIALMDKKDPEKDRKASEYDILVSEINRTKNQISADNDELKKLSAQVDANNATIDRYQETLNQSKSIENSLREQIAQKDAQYAAAFDAKSQEMAAALAARDVTIDALNKNLKSLQESEYIEDVQDAQDRVASIEVMKKEIEIAKKDALDKKRELEERNSELQAERKRLSDLIKQDHETRKNFKTIIESKEKEIESLISAKNELAKELEGVSDLRKKIDLLTIAGKTDELKIAQANLALLQGKIDQQEMLEDRIRQLELQLVQADAEKQLCKGSAERNTDKKRVDELTQRINTMETLIRSKDSLIDDLTVQQSKCIRNDSLVEEMENLKASHKQELSKKDLELQKRMDEQRREIMKNMDEKYAVINQSKHEMSEEEINRRIEDLVEKERKKIDALYKDKIILKKEDLDGLMRRADEAEEVLSGIKHKKKRESAKQDLEYEVQRINKLLDTISMLEKERSECKEKCAIRAVEVHSLVKSDVDLEKDRLGYRMRDRTMNVPTKPKPIITFESSDDEEDLHEELVSSPKPIIRIPDHSDLELEDEYIPTSPPWSPSPREFHEEKSDDDSEEIYRNHQEELERERKERVEKERHHLEELERKLQETIALEKKLKEEERRSDESKKRLDEEERKAEAIERELEEKRAAMKRAEILEQRRAKSNEDREDREDQEEKKQSDSGGIALDKLKGLFGDGERTGKLFGGKSPNESIDGGESSGEEIDNESDNESDDPQLMKKLLAMKDQADALKAAVKGKKK